MTCSRVKIRTTPYATLAEFDDGCRLVAHEGSYYEPDANTFDRIKEVLGAEGTTRIIRDSVAIPVVMAATVTFSILFYFLALNHVSRNADLVTASALLLLNIIVHELGHAVTLKFFLPQSRIRPGFRFMFVFPTIYINTSDSYLLPRGKKVSVHLAGVFANSIYLIIITLLSPSLLWPSSAVAGTMLLNLIPIMKGDGYHIVVAISGKRKLAASHKREVIEDCLRGIIMLAFAYLLTRLIPTLC